MELNMKTIEDQIKNLEFQIQFSETNLYLLRDEPENKVAIQNNENAIKEAKAELLKIIRENGLNEKAWAGFYLES